MKIALRPQSGSHDPSNNKNRTIIWGVLAGMFVFVGWASYAELDQITRAPGQVISSSRTQIIQAPDGGVLTELLVREGAQVQRGQLIAKLDATRAQAAFKETQARVAALRATLARINAEIFGGEPLFEALARSYPLFIDNQQALLRKRRSAIEEEIASIEQLRDLAQKELEMNEPLLKSGDVSRADIMRLQRQVADLRGQAINRKNRYLQELQAELSKTQEELAGVEQLMVQREEQLRNTQFTAPLDGVVSNVKVTTIGGVMRAGEELLQIVPLNDDLLIEAKVRPADVAFLKPGLPASVKVDAYDYTIYGSLEGKVTYISADTLQENLRQGEEPYYRVQVTTGRAFSSKPDATLAIQPGMTATVEIKTSSNTVLRYITKPVVKTMGEALGER
jgi:adhesin transport system membrane fusion protein